MTSPSTVVAILAALLFIIISSPAVYKQTNAITTRILRFRLSDAAGNPTRAGLVVHAAVMFGAMYLFARQNRL